MRIDIEDEESKIISDIALLCMFKRASFDVDAELEKYEMTINCICEKNDKSDILFSPYQFFSGPELEIVLQNYE